MRPRTLTETLMEGTIEEYATTLYDKTATSYMFGHCAYDPMFKCDIPTVAERFGGNGSGFRIGNAPNSITENSSGFGFRYRAGKHELYGMDHVNLDILNPIDNSSILQKIHIDWKKY